MTVTKMLNEVLLNKKGNVEDLFAKKIDFVKDIIDVVDRIKRYVRKHV